MLSLIDHSMHSTGCVPDTTQLHFQFRRIQDGGAAHVRQSGWLAVGWDRPGRYIDDFNEGGASNAAALAEGSSPRGGELLRTSIITLMGVW